MRFYKTTLEAVDNTCRDLLVRGITIECNSYQDKKLTGDDRFVKELTNVDFCITKPTLQRREALEYCFGKQAKKIEKYCQQEIKDRISGKPLNPGNSYKIRKDMWNQFLHNHKFSYTYAERMARQLPLVIDTLKKDNGTRQAVLSIWNPDLDMVDNKLGGGQRIPCSLLYQFTIRYGQLDCLYVMRSNSFFEHHVIDLYCASGIMEYIAKQCGVKVGALTFVAGSLHAFQWSLKNVKRF